MGFRLFRRVKILPGVTVNMSRSGPSLSLGPRGYKKTISKRGLRTTVGLPGTGIYYTDLESWKKVQGSQPGNPDPPPTSRVPASTAAARTVCPHCGHATGTSWLFCPHCGTRLP